jgi:hypothetical protein
MAETMADQNPAGSVPARKLSTLVLAVLAANMNTRYITDNHALTLRDLPSGHLISLRVDTLGCV